MGSELGGGGGVASGLARITDAFLSGLQCFVLEEQDGRHSAPSSFPWAPTHQCNFAAATYTAKTNEQAHLILSNTAS